MHMNHHASPLGAIAALLLLGTAVAACGSPQAQEGGAAMQQAARVQTVTVKAAPVTVTESLSGRAQAYQISEVRPQVSGLIKERIFIEGGKVETGDPLYLIEDTEYRAAVNSASAALARARATADVARQTADRYERLVESSAVSKLQHDQAVSAARQAEADVAMQQAALDSARTNLERTLIRAPISGQIGRSSVTVGALVTQNQAQSLATIRQLDPVYIDLTASSSDLLKWRRDLNAGRLANQDGNVPVTVTLEDGSVYDQTGTLEFTEVSIDETAGTVVLRATVPNPDNYILPGAFVRATLPVGTLDTAIQVPQAAVQRTPKGEAYAMVVSSEDTAEQRMLTVKTSKAGTWVVTDGLAPGDKLIVSGLMNLQPGMPVTVITEEPSGQGAAASANAAY